MTKSDLQKVRDALYNCAAIGDPHFTNKYEALAILDAALARDEKPVAWTHPDFDFAVMGKAPINPPIEEWTPLAAISSASVFPIGWVDEDDMAKVRTGGFGYIMGQTSNPRNIPVYLAPVAAPAPEDTKDAARYRFLKGADYDYADYFIGHQPEEWDAKIDAAMEQKP